MKHPLAPQHPFMAKVSGLIPKVQDSIVNRVLDREEAKPFVPANRGGAYTPISLPLSSASIANSAQGLLLPIQGHGLHYRKKGSNPGGILIINIGGDVVAFSPGDTIIAPFDSFTARNDVGGQVLGTAELLVYLQPNYRFEEPFQRAGLLLPTPIDLIGNSAAATFVAQGENAIPPMNSIIIGTVVGTFTLGETITGGTSGITGVVANKGTTGQSPLYLSSMSGSTFTALETVTGATSGATAVVSATSNSVAIGTGGPTMFDASGFSRVRVLLDTNSAGANATSLILNPWVYEPIVSVGLGNSSLNWFDGSISQVAVPDSGTTAQRYRSVVLDVAGRGYVFLQILSLLASARVSLGLIVQGIE